MQTIETRERKKERKKERTEEGAIAVLPISHIQKQLQVSMRPLY